MADNGMISLVGLDKAEVLAALYNASQPLGMGFLDYTHQEMTREEAQAELDALAPRFYFDYLRGRVMKVDLGEDELRPWLYDRDNGQGAALAALKPLLDARRQGGPDGEAKA